MRKKPLPQFGSIKENVDFYSKYGKLTYMGRVGHRCDDHLYQLDVIDGRRMILIFYPDGKVEEVTT